MLNGHSLADCENMVCWWIIQRIFVIQVTSCLFQYLPESVRTFETMLGALVTKLCKLGRYIPVCISGC